MTAFLRGLPFVRGIILSFSVLIWVSFAGCGEPGGKVYRVGILCGAEPFMGIADGFRSKMAELGYVENENILYDIRISHIVREEERKILENFVEDNVDMILAFPTEQAVQAKAVARDAGIPVVFAMAGIESNDLIDSVRQPGGNVTGVRFPNPEATAKRFEMLLSIVPDAKRIYYVYEVGHSNTAPALESLHTLAESYDLTLVEDPVHTVEEVRDALKKRESAGNTGIDAVFIMPDIISNSPEGFAAIIAFADKYSLPVAGGMYYTMQHGAMFGCAPDNFDQGMLAAISADKIFHGIAAGTIPVVTPELHLWLNYGAIERLGLTVPEELLYRAEEIIR